MRSSYLCRLLSSCALHKRFGSAFYVNMYTRGAAYIYMDVCMWYGLMLVAGVVVTMAVYGLGVCRVYGLAVLDYGFVSLCLYSRVLNWGVCSISTLSEPAQSRVTIQTLSRLGLQYCFLCPALFTHPLLTGNRTKSFYLYLSIRSCPPN
jgi:hypothetical protein